MQEHSAAKKIFHLCFFRPETYFTFFYLLFSIASFAAEPSGQPVPQDIPGPSRFWFLAPFMPSKNTASSSMDIVSLQIGKPEFRSRPTALRIPRSYIAQVSDPGQKIQSFITLVVYLPDYLPRALADKAGLQTRGELVNGIQLRNKAEIEIDLRATVPGSTKKFNERVKQDRILGENSDDKLKVYYNVLQKTPTSPRLPRKESGYLIPTDGEDVRIDFFTNLATSEMTGCRMHFEYENIELQVAFAGVHLSQYSEIRDRVLELVKPLIAH